MFSATSFGMQTVNPLHDSFCALNARFNNAIRDRRAAQHFKQVIRSLHMHCAQDSRPLARSRACALRPRLKIVRLRLLFLCHWNAVCSVSNNAPLLWHPYALAPPCRQKKPADEQAPHATQPADERPRGVCVIIRTTKPGGWLLLTPLSATHRRNKM